MQKHDEWYFTGAKATYGVFDAAAAANGGAVSPPFTTDLTDTAHGLIAGSLMYIEATDNYNGLQYVHSVPDANSIVIRAPFVAETIANTDTWKTKFSYDERRQIWGTKGHTIAAGPPWELLGFEVTLSSASATSENLTVTVDSAKSSSFDNLLYSRDMNGVRYINNMFDVPRKMGSGDKVDIAWANSNSRTWAIKIFTRRLV